MSVQRFSTGKRFYWKDAVYEVKMLLPEKRINIEQIETGMPQIVDQSELTSALFEGNLSFLLEGRQAQPSHRGEVSTRSEYEELSNYRPHLVEIARERLRIIKPLLEMDPNQRTERAVENRVAEVQAEYDANPQKGNPKIAVNKRSVYRWLDWYSRSGFDIRSLIPLNFKRGGKGVSRLEPEVKAIVEAVILDKAYRPEKVTVDDLLHEIAVRIKEESKLHPANRQLKMPSRATVARRLEAHNLYDRFAARHGSRAAKRELSQFKQIKKPNLPLERVEIDHTRADVIVVDDKSYLPLGRPWVTFCIDVATRYPVGFYVGFERPSYYSVMECLYHSIRPKENAKEKYGLEHDWQAYGIPLHLVIDNGKEFVGRDLADACDLLGIELQRTPVKQPHFKGTIERYFGTLNTRLFHVLPGTVFSNVRERGDYDSERRAVITLSELERAIYLFVVDVYAETFHRGLRDVPARRWEQAVKSGFMPRLPSNVRELFISLCRTDERIIQRYGLEFESLYYNCPELATLRARLKGKPVKIKYHPGDLSRLFAYDQFENNYIEVPAMAQEYAQGLSLWVHRGIREDVLKVKLKVDLASLGEAKRKRYAIAEEARKRKRLATRSQVARLDNSGNPPSLAEQRAMSSETFAERVVPSAELSSSNVLPVGLDEQALTAYEESTDAEWEIEPGALKTGRVNSRSAKED